MKRRIVFFTTALFIVMVLFAGCTSTQNLSTETTVTATATQTSAETITAEPTYSVTEPVLVIGEDVYSIKTTIDSEVSESNTLYVIVHYDSSTPFATTGVGSELMATIFAYNYDEVPYDFNPKTTDDVINAGIPYKKIQKVVYPNNEVDAAVELPTDSVQGRLNTAMPYNYGAVIEKVGTRN